MDKFDGVQRAEILSEAYAGETTPQPRQLQIQAQRRPWQPEGWSQPKEKTGKPPLPPPRKGRGRLLSACLRYGFCAVILGICLLGKLSPSGPLKTASGFIKDELSKVVISELYG